MMEKRYDFGGVLRVTSEAKPISKTSHLFHVGKGELVIGINVKRWRPRE